jgi:hypothetical protein
MAITRCQDEDETNHPKWQRQVTMPTMVMALITALGALLAGIIAYEDSIERTNKLID